MLDKTDEALLDQVEAEAETKKPVQHLTAPQNQKICNELDARGEKMPDGRYRFFEGWGDDRIASKLVEYKITKHNVGEIRRKFYGNLWYPEPVSKPKAFSLDTAAPLTDAEIRKTHASLSLQLDVIRAHIARLSKANGVMPPPKWENDGLLHSN